MHASPILRTVPVALTLAIALAAGGCKGSGGGGRGDGAERASGNPRDVAGRYVLTVNDADLPADPMGGSLLADRTAASRDAVTIVSLPVREPVTPSAQVEVSNSVFGPPGCVAVTRDGRFAYILETRGPGGEGSGRDIASLPVGENLTTVDLTDPMAPKVLGTTFIGKDPQGVAVHPDGDLLAIVTRNPRSQLVLSPLPDKGGQPGDPAAWPLLGLDDDEAQPSSVAWLPSGRGLAVTLPARAEVVFYAFRREPDGSLAVAAWGPPVKVGATPIAAVFTPDGRACITLDANRPVEFSTPASGPGQISVVALAGNPDAPGMGAAHRVIASAPVGGAPVGLAISPDGSLLAVANTQAASGGPGGSISLFALDKDNRLSPRGEFSIGAVPAGVSFDARGRYLLVSQYRSLDPSAQDGEVSFWRINTRGEPALVQQDYFLGIGAGPHGTLIVR